MAERHERQPELVDDRTIDLMVLAARALVLVIYTVVLVTFAILALGFFLHLAGASGEASFVEWVYRNTERAMEPFRGMFPIERLDDRSTFDPSLLFAAAFYGFFAIGLHAVVNYLTNLARSGRLHRPDRTTEEETRILARPDIVGRPTAGHPFVAGTADDDTEELALDQVERADRPRASVDS